MREITDMNYEVNSKDIDNEVRKLGMMGFDKYFVKFAFRTFLKKGAFTKEELEAFFKETPFKSYNY